MRSDYESRIQEIFVNAGWNVRLEVASVNKSAYFDLALLDEKEKLVAVVETKQFIHPIVLQQVLNLYAFAEEFSDLKFFILYVNDVIYIMNSDGAAELPLIPTPDNYRAILFWLKNNGSNIKDVLFSKDLVRRTNKSELEQIIKNFDDLSKADIPSDILHIESELEQIDSQISFSPESPPSKENCKKIAEIASSEIAKYSNMAKNVRERFKYIIDKNQCKTEDPDDWLVEITANDERFHLKTYDIILWSDTISLVYGQIKNYAHSQIRSMGISKQEEEDAEQEIKLIILENIPNYNSESGKFNTFLSPYIKNRLMEFNNKGRSHYYSININDCKKAINALAQGGNNNPTDKEIADKINDMYSSKKGKESMTAVKVRNALDQDVEFISLDKLVEDNSLFISGSATDTNNTDNYTNAYTQNMLTRSAEFVYFDSHKQSLMSFADKLSPLSKIIFSIYIDYYFPVNPVDEKTAKLKNKLAVSYIQRELNEKTSCEYTDKKTRRLIDIMKFELTQAGIQELFIH